MNKSGTHTIYTIGHSIYSLDHFWDMLQSFDIKILADIRSSLGSRRFPQFEQENLKISEYNTYIWPIWEEEGK